MSVKKLFQSNPLLGIFKIIFAGVLGAASAQMVIALYAIILCGIGYLIITKYNKENTKNFEEIQSGQYIGIVLGILGLLPYVQYFFMGFMFEGGEYAFGKVFDLE